MNADPLLILRLLAALGTLQLVASGLARLLGRRLRAEVVAAGFVVPLLLLLPWLLGPAILVPDSNLSGAIPGAGPPREKDPHTLVFNDVPYQLAPWEIEVRRQLGSGRLPFWSDLIDGGSSPWSNPQAAVLSPISMPARLLPIRHHFLATLALKLLLALEGTWVAARIFGLRRPAALLTAAGFALGGGMLAWGLYPHASAIAWTPWCLAAGHRLARRRSIRLLVGATLVFALLFLSGQPEIALGIGIATAAVTLFAGRKRRLLRGFARLVVAGALAMSLTAPLVLPFVAVADASQRALDMKSRSTEVDHRARPWLPPVTRLVLRAPLSPWATGVPFASPSTIGGLILQPYSAYAGLLAVSGLGALLVWKRRGPRARFFVAVWILALAVGSGLPAVTRPWSRLPVLNLVATRNWIPLATLALTLAGGVGLDRLLRCRSRSTAAWGAAWLALVLAGCWAVAPGRGVALVGVATVAAALLAPRRARRAVQLRAAAPLGDQLRWGRHLLPAGDPALLYPRTAAMATLIDAAGGPGGRAVGNGFSIYPSVLSTYEVSDPRPHNPLAPRRYLDTLAAAFDFAPNAVRYFSSFSHPERPFLDFLGVRAVLSNRFVPAIPGMRKQPLDDPFFVLYENPSALARQFLAPGFDLVPPPRLGPWIEAMTDPRRVALDPAEAGRLAGVRTLRHGRVRVLARAPGRLSLAVPATGTKLLATSYPGPGGWQARAGSGKRLERLTVNGAFLGVVVPPGTARVELVYRPPGFDLGLGFLLAGATTLALLAQPRVRRLLLC